VSYFTNDLDTRTREIDAVLSYASRVGPGRVDLSLAYNYNQTKVQSDGPSTTPRPRSTTISARSRSWRLAATTVAGPR
jgi:hypothetical protein